MEKRNARLAILLVAVLTAGSYFLFRSPGGKRREGTPVPPSVSGKIDRAAHDEDYPFRGTNAPPLADDAIRIAEAERLLALRRAGKIDDYIREARSWLTTNRVDLFATDVMTLYARARNTNEFHAFGIAYATNSPNLLLEFADIADNERWPEMNAAFARETANAPNASFAQLRRSLRFLMDCNERGDFSEILDRMQGLAVKRHERESLSLLRCEIAVRNGAVPPEVAAELRSLSDDAMMPPVRESASKLLSQLEQKP
ncbi:MAG: hypothetical protein IJR99_11645 [Kiritimatiellae bacterium]|nr:hypothetical protein [Kiritimatiellia bacterium]